MTDRVQATSQENETQVRELTSDELAHVDGGTDSGGILVAMGDGSVTPAGTAGYNTWRTNFGRTS